MTRLAKAPHPAAYHLDIRAPIRRHSDATEFTVTALWLAGFAASNIAKTIGLRRSQVLGIAHRSPFENRSSMTDQERQAALSDLQEIRCQDGLPLDHGRLDSFDWRIRSIGDGRKRRSKTVTS